jgi:hypothetical protein
MKKKNYYLRVVLPKKNLKKKLKSEPKIFDYAKWRRSGGMSNKEIDKTIEDLVIS